MKKFLGFGLFAALLTACGSGGGGGGGSSASNGVFGSVVVSPVSGQAASLGALPPDAEPVTGLAADEGDSLNPASGVIAVTTQSADAEPLALGPLPASANDPDKPNS